MMPSYQANDDPYVPQLDNLLGGAVSAGDFQSAIGWIQKGANPFTRINSYSVLHHAIESKCGDLLTCALQYGANVHAKYSGIPPPLHFSAGLGNQEAMRVLLGYVGINRRAADGQTPLHFSAGYNADTRLATELICKGADLKARNGWGETPLQVLCP